jgi:hypothetical protein
MFDSETVLEWQPGKIYWYDDHFDYTYRREPNADPMPDLNPASSESLVVNRHLTSNYSMKSASKLRVVRLVRTERVPAFPIIRSLRSRSQRGRRERLLSFPSRAGSLNRDLLRGPCDGASQWNNWIVGGKAGVRSQHNCQMRASSSTIELHRSHSQNVGLSALSMDTGTINQASQFPELLLMEIAR